MTTAAPPLTFEYEPTNDDVLICPHFRCATCGEKITDARAVVTFETDNHRRTGNISVRHQGACDRLGGRAVPWQSLAQLLQNLCRNSAVDPALLRECADLNEKDAA
jgi:hypothetical protein